MLELIDDLGEAHVVDRDQGSVAVVVDLPPEGIGSVLRETLRAVARGIVQMPHLFR